MSKPSKLEFVGANSEFIEVHKDLGLTSKEPVTVMGRGTMKQTKPPNPGSQEAIDKGCTCPVMDNGHGAGYMGQKDVFVYTKGCPVHPWLGVDDE